MLVAASASVAVLILVKGSFYRSAKKQDGTNKFDSFTASLSSSEVSVSPCGEQYDRPMFDYSDQQLAQTVLKMARDRAKRWMSFQVQPSDCSHMVGQVGGKSLHKRPLLTLEHNLILKPINMDHRGIREVAFYEAMEAANPKNRPSNEDTYCQLFGPRDYKPPSIKDTLLSWLYGRNGATLNLNCCQEFAVEKETRLLRRLELFTPEYFGVVDYTSDSTMYKEIGSFGTTVDSHLLLYNLTSSFSKPCVLDMKMGTETYESDALDDKKLREHAKYPVQLELGFRMVGMRVHDARDAKADKDGYIYFPKSFGRSLQDFESVKLALQTFFGGNDLPSYVKENRAKAIKRILTQLKLIKTWFKDNDIFTFSASSILIIYEGDTETNEESGLQLDLATAKMIDFGRVRRRPDGDIGYLKGLRTLIQILEEILKETFWMEEYEYRE